MFNNEPPQHHQSKSTTYFHPDYRPSHLNSVALNAFAVGVVALAIGEQYPPSAHSILRPAEARPSKKYELYSTSTGAS